MKQNLSKSVLACLSNRNTNIYSLKLLNLAVYEYNSIKLLSPNDVAVHSQVKEALF